MLFDCRQTCIRLRMRSKSRIDWETMGDQKQTTNYSHRQLLAAHRTPIALPVCRFTYSRCGHMWEIKMRSRRILLSARQEKKFIPDAHKSMSTSNFCWSARNFLMATEHVRSHQFHQLVWILTSCVVDVRSSRRRQSDACTHASTCSPFEKFSLVGRSAITMMMTMIVIDARRILWIERNSIDFKNDFNFRDSLDRFHHIIF